MINWAKPVLIGGVHETFKLAGTVNDCQLVVTTTREGSQTLFKVFPDGSSLRMPDHGATAAYVGPLFENEPETVTIKPACYMNVYADGTWYCYSNKSAAQCGMPALATLEIVPTVDAKGKIVTVKVGPV